MKTTDEMILDDIGGGDGGPVYDLVADVANHAAVWDDSFQHPANEFYAFGHGLAGTPSDKDELKSIAVWAAIGAAMWLLFKKKK